jgi:4-alpha-glucanotransferase
MNTPAKPEGNWRWRLKEGQFDRLSGATAGYLRELGRLTGRCR